VLYFMKAATIDSFSTPARVHFVNEPVLQDESVIFRVTAAGVNPVDWKTRDGLAGKRSFPLTLGQDFAGVVLRVGKGIVRVKRGDRIFGCARAHGSYAEIGEIRDGMADSPFTRIPANVSDAQAAALPTPALTALASLEALAVRYGTKLLILGAAGAVGSIALQLARMRGASITAVVKNGQEPRSRSMGASSVVSATSDDTLSAVRAVHPEPFDAVRDLVSGGDELKRNAPLSTSGGILVTTIHDADVPWFRQLNICAINITMSKTPQSSPAALDDIAHMVANGTLLVEIASERPLDEANAVLDEIKAGVITGKVILRP
jgi:NADPH:quinone reductase-like Zn-dependent oxidoreductase